MEIHPIAIFHSPFTSKFGIPRQSGIAATLKGCIVFEPEYRNKDALRGIDGFDYLWLIWGFSCNTGAEKHPTVRPPRLGGNRQMGVWATRSPFRPNNLGLSSVKIEKIDMDTAEGPVIHVLGADLMDGTPIYDIKPYLPAFDSHEGVRAGFTDEEGWERLSVVIPDDIAEKFDTDGLAALREALSLDPRPHYHDDAERIYGMPFGDYDVKFRVEGTTLTVTDLRKFTIELQLLGVGKV